MAHNRRSQRAVPLRSEAPPWRTPASTNSRCCSPLPTPTARRSASSSPGLRPSSSPAPPTGRRPLPRPGAQAELHPGADGCGPLGYDLLIPDSWKKANFFASAQAFRVALGDREGPTTLRLCPDTTYRGFFNIIRNVRVLGAGADSRIFAGDEANPVVFINSIPTAAEQRCVQIREGGDNANGGGVYNAGVLTLTGCTITENQGLLPGGGIMNEGTLTLTRCAVTKNRGGEREALSGAGIFNRGTLTLTESTVTGNEALTAGGGIFTAGGAVTLIASEVSENVAPHGGGIALQGFGARLTLCGGTIVTDNEAEGVYNTPYDSGGDEIFGTSAVVGNRPEDCVGPGCPP